MELNYLDNKWPCADGLSAVNVIDRRLMNKVFQYGFLKNTSSQPRMKHSYVFSVRHDLKKTR